MTNPNKRKGDKAEREAAELLTEVTGFECKRNLAAGIPDDVGDIYGIPNCVIQVADYKEQIQSLFSKTQGSRNTKKKCRCRLRCKHGQVQRRTMENGVNSRTIQYIVTSCLAVNMIYV